MISTSLAVGVALLMFLLRDLERGKRITQLEGSVTFLLQQVLTSVDPDVAQARWVAHRDYHEHIQKMHQMVLRARSTGNLDLANKMMELQHWAERNYSAEWLDGMFRGFP